jgi:hypothetical protein
MRHLAWLSSVLLALSCAVDNSNLNVDAGGGTGGGVGTGGSVGAGGSAGAGGAGGCPRCAPTGGTGGALGGQSGAGGTIGGAGGSGTGGSVAGMGGNGIGGKGAGGATGSGGKGGATGTGGKGTGGSTGTGGQGGNPSCDALTTDYTTALGQAKLCTPGAPDQCQQMVDSSLSCPGCQTYVNDTTMLDAIDAQWAAAGCDKMHFVCPAIACVVPGPASCVPSGAGPGPVAGTCVGSNLVTGAVN